MGMEKPQRTGARELSPVLFYADARKNLASTVLVGRGDFTAGLEEILCEESLGKRYYFSTETSLSAVFLSPIGK